MITSFSRSFVALQRHCESNGRLHTIEADRWHHGSRLCLFFSIQLSTAWRQRTIHQLHTTTQYSCPCTDRGTTGSRRSTNPTFSSGGRGILFDLTFCMHKLSYTVHFRCDLACSTAIRIVWRVGLRPDAHWGAHIALCFKGSTICGMQGSGDSRPEEEGQREERSLKCVY